MLFAHDTQEALSAAADLVNTGQPGSDALPDAGALEAFLQRWGWTGSRRGDAAELAAVHALRPLLRRLWDAELEEVVQTVNGMLTEAAALPQLVRHSGYGYHLHATSPEAPLAQRMAVEAAMAMVDVVRQDELARLRACAAEGCSDVLVDLSKNRSRRFCSGACANRTNVAAFRARLRGNG